MPHDTLSDFVEASAAHFGIPGVAVAVWADGQEGYACHGVTSIDNPLPIDKDTVYVLGSVTKTFTATALTRLVADGRVELDAPVLRYVPELRLADERAAAEITVLNLLNHTSGLGWDLMVDTGEGDDALASFVAHLAELELIAPPGERASYSQAGYSLLGRIVEMITGTTYERAIASLVLEPLGLSHSFFTPEDAMTRRFAVGHNPGDDGTLSVARLWRGPRCRNPGGGMASSVGDQLRWARFHLGDGRAKSDTQVLPAEMLHRMKEPTVALRGSTRWVTLSASAGSCATSTACALSDTAGRRMASSPSSSPCRNGGSPSSRSPIPARTVSPSTKRSCVGPSRPIWTSSTGIRSRSRTTRRGPARSSGGTTSTS